MSIEREEILEGEIEGLEDEVQQLRRDYRDLEDELYELRGPVDVFPNAQYADDPAAYIKKFNEMRHFK